MEIRGVIKMFETLDERIQVSFEKVNTFFSQGDFVKTIFLDFIRNSLESGDFIDLIDRASDMMDITVEESQIIIVALFYPERLETIRGSVSQDSYIFLKMLANTYGSNLQDLRSYTFAENKLSLSESNLFPFDKKIGITVKRVDMEEFYFETKFSVALNFMSSLVQNLQTAINKNDNIVSKDTWDEILNLKSKVAFLQQEAKIEGGDLDGGEE